MIVDDGVELFTANVNLRASMPQALSARTHLGLAPIRCKRGGFGEGEALPGQRLVPLEALGSQVGA